MKKIVVLFVVLLFTGFLVAQDVTYKKLPSVNVKTLEGESFNTSDIYNDGKPILISSGAKVDVEQANQDAVSLSGRADRC